jgi:hypothetical protein
MATGLGWATDGESVAQHHVGGGRVDCAMHVAWIAPATAQRLLDTIKLATTRLRARLRRGPQPQAAPPPPTPAAEPDQLIHI